VGITSIELAQVTYTYSLYSVVYVWYAIYMALFIYGIYCPRRSRSRVNLYSPHSQCHPSVFLFSFFTDAPPPFAEIKRNIAIRRLPKLNLYSPHLQCHPSLGLGLRSTPDPLPISYISQTARRLFSRPSPPRYCRSWAPRPPPSG